MQAQPSSAPPPLTSVPVSGGGSPATTDQAADAERKHTPLLPALTLEEPQAAAAPDHTAPALGEYLDLATAPRPVCEELHGTTGISRHAPLADLTPVAGEDGHKLREDGEERGGETTGGGDEEVKEEEEEGRGGGVDEEDQKHGGGEEGDTPEEREDRVDGVEGEVSETDAESKVTHTETKAMSSESEVIQTEPKVTSEDPKVTSDDPKVTSDDPKVTHSDPEVACAEPEEPSAGEDTDTPHKLVPSDRQAVERDGEQRPGETAQVLEEGAQVEVSGDEAAERDLNPEEERGTEGELCPVESSQVTGSTSQVRTEGPDGAERSPAGADRGEGQKERREESESQGGQEEKTTEQTKEKEEESDSSQGGRGKGDDSQRGAEQAETTRADAVNEHREIPSDGSTDAPLLKSTKKVSFEVSSDPPTRGEEGGVRCSSKTLLNGDPAVTQSSAPDAPLSSANGSSHHGDPKRPPNISIDAQSQASDQVKSPMSPGPDGVSDKQFSFHKLCNVQCTV